MIVCGDACINFYLDKRDDRLKERITGIPITFLIVHGNHEERAWNVKGYKLKEHKIGADNYVYGYSEEKYPNIIFVQDFHIETLNGKRFMFLGGAYSVDKFYRLAMNWYWFESEQMPEDEMLEVLKFVTSVSNFDYVVSHTCPYKYIPTEAFLPSINQNTVDQSTEYFLDEVDDLIQYKQWYCGHWHIKKEIQKLKFLFDDIIEI